MHVVWNGLDRGPRASSRPTLVFELVSEILVFDHRLHRLHFAALAEAADGRVTDRFEAVKSALSGPDGTPVPPPRGMQLPPPHGGRRLSSGRRAIARTHPRGRYFSDGPLPRSRGSQPAPDVRNVSRPPTNQSIAVHVFPGFWGCLSGGLFSGVGGSTHRPSRVLTPDRGHTPPRFG